MAQQRERNATGWLALGAGVVLLAVGVFQFWRLWDAPAGSAGTDGLLFPVILGLVMLGIGLNSVIRNKPLTDTESVRYPYLLKNKERAEAAAARSEQLEAKSNRTHPQQKLRRRPGNPTGLLVFGAVAVLIGIAVVPVAVADVNAVARGIPFFLIPVFLIPTGAYLVVVGAVWWRRDRRSR